MGGRTAEPREEILKRMSTTDRERELIRRLDELRERFAKDARPLWDELAEIEMRKRAHSAAWLQQMNKASFDWLYPGLPYPDLVEKDGVFYEKKIK